ncbi:MAG: multicopper oxidase domain-containing protein [bacterium]
MTQTYHQANGQPTEGGGCLKFGITSVLFLSAISVIFMLVVSVKPTSPPSASAAAGAITVEAFDLGFTVPTIDVASAGAYTVTFKNTGAAPHDVTLPDGQTLAAQPGKVVTAVINIPAGGTTFSCSIPGHAAAGMTGSITVAGMAVHTGDSHGGPAPVTDVAADPNAPDYIPKDATAPTRLSGTIHDIDLVMNEKLMTVAKGFQQAVWTFGDSVPGPVIRVRVGDLVRIHLKNPITNKMPHSIDFHSSMVAWNDEMTSIQPGEEKLYEFKAMFAGVWMYHCGTSPALHHIANGMYGMMIVEPKGGLSKVDQEFAIVQSEWYLGPQGQPASLEKASAAAPAPDFILFNGVASQYLDHPIKIATGKRVRLFILNAGPSVDSSFHIVGTIFDRVVKEGVELKIGNTGNYGSQAVDLSPAQGAFVEFIMAEDGLYPIVTHAFNFVGRGALGLFQAGDGDPKN